ALPAAALSFLAMSSLLLYARYQRRVTRHRVTQAEQA
ncbi:hypothetical protein, partial [Klebsiella aerogenes]